MKGEFIMVDELLTVKQVSLIMKSNVNYVNSLIHAGLLDSLKLGSRKIRTSTLNAFFEKWEGWDLSDPKNPKQLKNENKEQECNL